jgi:UPF0755 protein
MIKNNIKMKFTRKNILIVLSIIAILVILLGQRFYNTYFKPNVNSTLTNDLLRIPTNTSYSKLVQVLYENGFVKDTNSFKNAAIKMNYAKSIVRSGQFRIKEGWNNKSLIQHLRSGKQEPVKFVLTVKRLPEEIAGVCGRFFEKDSLTFLTLLQDTAFLKTENIDPAALLSYFIPNTYEMYWNTTPEQWWERMKKEHSNFWENNQRLDKAKALSLTPLQVYTVASIVERESNVRKERPTIAGVYLNRLKIEMPLQADPTVVFATRQFDAKRVTFAMLNTPSPYNTYLNKGLPPGPISVADISAIDAVLNPENHKYLYFCAKADNSATHAFAETLEGHNENVKKFHAWLNQRGIMK